MPPSCALLGGFAIKTWVALLCNITRTRNVSEYMLVLALYLVCFGILNNCNTVFCTLYFAFYNLLFLFILHHFDAAGNAFDI